MLSLMKVIQHTPVGPVNMKYSFRLNASIINRQNWLQAWSHDQSDLEKPHICQDSIFRQNKVVKIT